MASDATGTGGRRPLRIGKYEILAHIATGGMGAVYKARDVDLNRLIALKILTPELAAKPSMVDRFRREARSAAKLRHDNIVAIYEFGEFNGTHFLALEFVDGPDLHTHISRKGKVDLEEARQILIQTAKALDHAHRQGIVHRDIKPSNLLLGQKEGQLLVKLTDLGLARQVNEDEFRITRPGMSVGTVDYMAPEQAKNSQAADIRSDIYSLGCTFYHMLAGQAPFPDGSLAERIYQHFEAEPADVRQLNPQVTPEIASIIQRMLAKKPQDRYQTPLDLLKDLESPEKLRVYLDQAERLVSLAKLVDDGPGKPKRSAPPSSALPRQRLRDEASAAKGAKPAWLGYVPWAGAALAVLVAGIVVWLQLGASTPAPQKKLVTLPPPEQKPLVEVEEKVQKEAPSLPKTPEPVTEIVGPPEPSLPRFYDPQPPPDRAALLREFMGELAEFPEPSPQAKVVRVSRFAADQPGWFRTLSDACQQATGETIVEIHDNGPLFTPPLNTLKNRTLTIRPGAGFRPLLAWDYEANGDADPSRQVENLPPPHALMRSENGRLILQDLDLVFYWPEAEQEPPPGLLVIKSGEFFAQGCTFSVAGRAPQGLVLLHLEGESGPCRCRLSRCHVRGTDVVALHVADVSADVLLDQCLVVSQHRPLIQVSGPATAEVALRLTRSTLVTGQTALRCAAREDKPGMPKLQVRALDSLLAHGDSLGPSTAMLQLTPGAGLAQVSWRAVNCLYSGWGALLHAPEMTIDKLSLWRHQWNYQEGDHELFDTWPARPWPAEMVPAAQYTPYETQACFAALSAAGPLGCPTGALPADPGNWAPRTYEHRQLALPPLPDTGFMPPIPPEGDGFYHGERLDLTKIDLGQYLRTKLAKVKPGPRVVLHLSGTGEQLTSPLRVKNVKHLVLYVDQPGGSALPLTLRANPSTTGDGGPLIELLDGRLEIYHLRLQLENSRIAPAPSQLVRVRGALSLARCRLQGPLDRVPDVYRSLIYVLPAASLPVEESGLVVKDCILLSGKQVIALDGPCRWRIRDSVLLGVDDVFHVQLGAHPENRPDIVGLLEHNTLAMGQTMLHLSGKLDRPANPEAVLIQASDNYFLDPFTGGGRSSALIRFPAADMPHGLMLWQGKGNAFAESRLWCLAAPEGVPSPPRQTLQDWRRIWGSFGVQQPRIIDSGDSSVSLFTPGLPLLERLSLPEQAKTIGTPPPGADLVRLGIVKKK